MSVILTAAMVINVIARGGDVFANIRSLVFDNHESRPRQYELARRALGIFRTLVVAGVVEVVPAEGPAAAPGIRLTVDLQPNFALNQPLSPFALAAIELLDPEDGAGNAPGAGIGTLASRGSAPKVCPCRSNRPAGFAWPRKRQS